MQDHGERVGDELVYGGQTRRGGNGYDEDDAGPPCKGLLRHTIKEMHQHTMEEFVKAWITNADERMRDHDEVVDQNDTGAEACLPYGLLDGV